jgi:predicted nicotinamide N-methyase
VHADDDVEEVVAIGGRSLAIVHPPSADDLIDEAAFEREEFLPYWAELWPSSVALARHVAGLPLDGVSVLELGCGLALPSIAAALGGADVLATDWSPDALRYARANAERNGASLRTCLLRWARAGALPRFELVLAADVLYEERNAHELLALLPRVVAPGGTALVADPGRFHARTFLEGATARWQVESLPAGELGRGAIHRLRHPGAEA